MRGGVHSLNDNHLKTSGENKIPNSGDLWMGDENPITFTIQTLCVDQAMSKSKKIYPQPGNWQTLAAT